MQSIKTKQITMTAAILALSIVFQYIRLIPVDVTISAYLIGTLVNLCLIVASSLIGLWSGLALSVAAPLVALLQQYAKLPLVPFIIAGNVILVLLYSLVAAPALKKTGKIQLLSWTVAGVVSAVVKFAVIAAGMALMLSSMKGKPFTAMLAAGAAQQVQQIVTALLAMVVAVPVIPGVKKAAKL